MLTIMVPTVEAVIRTDAGLASELRVSVIRLAHQLNDLTSEERRSLRQVAPLIERLVTA
jgi:hypothetical protein